MTHIEAMKQALKALEEINKLSIGTNAIFLPAEIDTAMDDLRQAIEQAEKQEPVAWRTFDGEGGYDYRSFNDNENYADEWEKRNPKHKSWVEPLYTSPQPQKPWVGLTDEEIDKLHGSPMELEHSSALKWVRIIEAKLKEKNCAG